MPLFPILTYQLKDQKLAYGFADRRFFGLMSYTMKILTHREERITNLTQE